MNHRDSAVRRLIMACRVQCPGGVVRSSMKPCRGFDPGSKIAPWWAIETPGQGVFTLGPVAQPGTAKKLWELEHLTFNQVVAGSNQRYRQ